MCKADWLSQKSVTGCKFLTPNSCSKLTAHVTSEAAAAMALYSASELERETVACFFDFQVIGEPPQ